MKKSKVVLAIVLAIALVIIVWNVPTFSWFSRPHSQNGAQAVLGGSNGAYSLNAYNAYGVSIATYPSNDGFTYSNTATTNYNGSNIPNYNRKYFKTLEAAPHIYSEISGHEAIVSLTALGFGLSVVPRLVYELSPFKNDVVIVKELPWSNFRVALCSLKNRAKDQNIKVINDLAARLAPSFTPDLTRRRGDN